MLKIETINIGYMDVNKMSSEIQLNSMNITDNKLDILIKKLQKARDIVNKESLKK